VDVALPCVTEIGNEDSLPIGVDSSLQLLAIQSKSFNVELGEFSDSGLPIRVWNDSQSANGHINFATVSVRRGAKSPDRGNA
jgi:hypothetical protein